MNGFLDTLAARTLAPAPAQSAQGAVRPRVRALFEPDATAADVAIPDIDAAQHDSRVDAAPPSAAARPAPGLPDNAMPVPAPWTAARAQRQAPLHVEDPAAQAAAAEPTPARASARLTPAPAPGRVSDMPQPAPAAAPPRPLAPAPRQAPSLAAPVPPLPPARAEGEHAPARRAMPPAQDAANRSATDTRPRYSAGMPERPDGTHHAPRKGALQPAPPAPRLTPPQLVVQPPRREPSERADARERREAHADAAPVHVSIGRIEIRAAAPPRVPVRERATLQPLALEDYLRQRARGDKP